MRNCVKKKKKCGRKSRTNLLLLLCAYVHGNPLRTLHPLGDDFGPDLHLLFKMHEIWLVAFLENRQNCCHQMSDFMAKSTSNG